MTIPNPSNSNEVYMFSRYECVLMHFGRYDGMFACYAESMNINIVHVQIHPTFISSRRPRPSKQNGPRSSRPVFGNRQIHGPLCKASYAFAHENSDVSAVHTCLSTSISIASCSPRSPFSFDSFVFFHSRLSYPVLHAGPVRS